jgi:hypothetical protein
MASASKLRTVSRFIGVLALVIAIVRMCVAVMQHTALPWMALIISIVVCVLLWMMPVASDTDGSRSAAR